MLAIRSFNPIDQVLDAWLPTSEQNNWTWQGFSPPADVRESENGYVLELDLPGLTEKEVEVKLEGKHLTISGERKPPTPDGYTRQERGYGPFERVFHLPDDVDSTHIEAKAKNGVLTLMLPKAESAKPKTVTIVAG